MVASIISGKEFASRLRKKVATQVSELKSSLGSVPGLDVILVGNNPASEIYVKNKAKQTIEVGMQSTKHMLSKNVSEDELLKQINTVNIDDSVHGILVQLPLPDHINTQKSSIPLSQQKMLMDSIFPMLDCWQQGKRR